MNTNSKKIFSGVLFLAAAAYVVLSAIGLFGGIGIFSIIMTVLMVAAIIEGVRSLNYYEILVPVAVLMIIYDEPLHLEAITPFPVLIAAILASIGLTMIFGKKNHYQGGGDEDHFASVINEPDSNHIYVDTSFSSSIKYVNTDNFQYAKFSTSFGAIKAYFDNTQIQGNDALIEVDVQFGGIDLYIPKEWNVVNQVNVTFAGVDEKNHSVGGGPAVYIRGNATFGGVKIFYV